MHCPEVRFQTHLEDGLQAFEGDGLAAVDGILDEAAEGRVPAVRLILQKPEVAVQVADRVLDRGTGQAPPPFRLLAHTSIPPFTNSSFSHQKPTLSSYSILPPSFFPIPFLPPSHRPFPSSSTLYFLLSYIAPREQQKQKEGQWMAFSAPP